MKRITGTYEILGSLNSFIPNPLPPIDPELDLSKLTDLYGSAMLHIGRLNEIALRLPNAARFIKAYVIKEALLSSAIEGIHTTLLEVFTQPLSGSAKPNKETQLILNYTKALDIAMHMIQEEGFPIVSRVILNAHEALMRLGQGDQASPGNYRKQAVRVGNLIPPPAPHIPRLMSDLETFINSNNSLSPLIKAGLSHVQFETIHPFLDGNGRIGRLLIVLMLVKSNLLSAPILYPSYYFKKNHFEYYQRLDGVRLHGDFEGWIEFYLKAIEASSIDAYRRAKDIENLEQDIKNSLLADAQAAKIQDIANVISVLFQFPIISVTKLAQQLNKSYNTARSIIQLLVNHGVVHEMTGNKRNKTYQFDAYLKLLEREYD